MAGYTQANIFQNIDQPFLCLLDFLRYLLQNILSMKSEVDF